VPIITDLDLVGVTVCGCGSIDGTSTGPSGSERLLEGELEFESLEEVVLLGALDGEILTDGETLVDGDALLDGEGVVGMTEGESEAAIDEAGAGPGGGGDGTLVDEIIGVGDTDWLGDLPSIAIFSARTHGAAFMNEDLKLWFTSPKLKDRKERYPFEGSLA